jgi:hypothetical protein
MAENQNRETYPNENLGQGNSSDKLNEKRTGNKQKNKGKKGGSAMETRANTSTEGYGSSQRSGTDSNVGPLDADLNELPSKRRSS